jgi:hypothetical protein
MPRPPRPKSHKALSLFAVGGALVVVSFAHHGKSDDGLLLAGLLCIGIGFARLLTDAPYLLARLPLPWKPLPKKEVMKLAEARNGILTLSETATALDIDPALADKTLKALSKMGIATQRWQDYRKNVWEFPDYIHLPIAQTLDLAKKKGGRISLNDLVASGHSIETATQTLDTLSEKGLAQQDPTTPSRTVILNTQ